MRLLMVVSFSIFRFPRRGGSFVIEERVLGQGPMKNERWKMRDGK
jgi:hypothetical protein